MTYPKHNLIRSVLIAGLISTAGLQLLHAESLEPSAGQPGDPVYDLWNTFYKIEKTDPQQAEQLLEQLSQKTPNDLRVWKSLTYLRINQKKPEEALSSLVKARALAPQDEQLALQQAYVLNGLSRNDEALVIFKSLQHSSHAETKATAEQAVKNLQGSQSSSESSRYFADIYFSPSYEGRFDLGLFPLKIRAGRYFGEGQQGQAYAFTSINRDTRSSGNTNPEILGSNAVIFDDNAAIAGLGVSYQPWLHMPVRAYAEVGGSYDLIDRDRDKFRESIVAGLAGYQEWTGSSVCDQRHCPNGYVDAYGNIASYSRENYAVLADFRLRSGLAFANNRVQLYGKLHTINDTAHQYYNNLAEAGPGIAWKPFAHLPIALRVEKLYGKYVSSTPSDVKDTYNNTRVELTIYQGF